MKIQKIFILLVLILQSFQTLDKAKLEEILKNVQSLEKSPNKENKKEKQDRNLIYLGAYSPLSHPSITGFAALHSGLGPYHSTYPYFGLGAHLIHPLNPYNMGYAGYPGAYPGMFPGLYGMNMFGPFVGGHHGGMGMGFGGVGGMGYNPYFMNNLMPLHGIGSHDHSDPSDPHDFRKLSVDNNKENK